jgi:hypothetical protein
MSSISIASYVVHFDDQCKILRNKIKKNLERTCRDNHLRLQSSFHLLSLLNQIETGLLQKVPINQ